MPAVKEKEKKLTFKPTFQTDMNLPSENFIVTMAKKGTQINVMTKSNRQIQLALSRAHLGELIELLESLRTIFIPMVDEFGDKPDATD